MSLLFLEGDGSDSLFIAEISCSVLTVAFVDASNILRYLGNAIVQLVYSFGIERACVNSSRLPVALTKACSFRFKRTILEIRKLCKIRNFSQSPFGGLIFEESGGNFLSRRN